MTAPIREGPWKRLLYFPFILCLTSGINDTNSILSANDTGGRDNDERIAVKNA